MSLINVSLVKSMNYYHLSSVKCIYLFHVHEASPSKSHLFIHWTNVCCWRLWLLSGFSSMRRNDPGTLQKLPVKLPSAASGPCEDSGGLPLLPYPFCHSQGIGEFTQGDRSPKQFVYLGSPSNPLSQIIESLLYSNHNKDTVWNLMHTTLGVGEEAKLGWASTWGSTFSKGGRGGK